MFMTYRMETLTVFKGHFDLEAAQLFCINQSDHIRVLLQNKRNENIQQDKSGSKYHGKKL